MNHKTSNKKSKKSQMELMGLTIVVILIILGILFAIKFVVLKKPADTKQAFTRSQLASNLGLTLLQSTTKNCKNADMTQLFTDCAQWIETGGLLVCDEGNTSCVYLNTTLSTILHQTLD